MSTLHFRNAKIEVNGVDLSSFFDSIAINYSSEVLDQTAFGQTTRIHKGGLLAWQITGQANQDFSSGAVDGTLFSLVGTSVCIEVRPQNICSTAINPIYSGIALLSKYNPVGGNVGTLLKAPLTLDAMSVLTRASSCG